MEPCEDTGTFCCAPTAPCPLHGSSALQDTPGWHCRGAEPMEVGCRPGVWMGSGKSCGTTAHSGRFSWKPQTKIRWLNPPRAWKKPSLPSAPEQAGISVHHSWLASSIYGFNQICEVSTGRAAALSGSCLECGRREESQPCSARPDLRKIQTSSSKLCCPRATLPMAASPPTGRDTGSSSLPLLWQSSFNYWAPFTEPSHFPPVSLHHPIFSVSSGFHRDEYGIRSEAL